MRRNFLKAAALAVAGLAIGMPAMAGQGNFTQAAFLAAQAAGKPILVAVHADWCPVCAKQKPILSKLYGEAAFKDLVVFTVDFDSQKDIVKGFGVQMQSTLIVFHGAAERARSTGATAEDVIQGLLTKAMS